MSNCQARFWVGCGAAGVRDSGIGKNNSGTARLPRTLWVLAMTDPVAGEQQISVCVPECLSEERKRIRGSGFGMKGFMGSWVHGCKGASRCAAGIVKMCYVSSVMEEVLECLSV